VLSLTTDKYVTYRGGPSTELYRVWTGPRKRSPPLPKITLLSYPHLGLTQGSANPRFNWKASPWERLFHDHGSSPAR